MSKENYERKKIREFLGQYILAVQERERLENQRRRIERDYRNGAPASKMVIEEVQIQIDEQISRNAALLVQIKDILNYLPENSTPRKVLDAVYIDGMSCAQCERHFNYSSASVKRYIAAGLDELLKYERVRELIKDMKKNAH